MIEGEQEENKPVEGGEQAADAGEGSEPKEGGEGAADESADKADEAAG